MIEQNYFQKFLDISAKLFFFVHKYIYHICYRNKLETFIK